LPSDIIPPGPIDAGSGLFCQAKTTSSSCYRARTTSCVVLAKGTSRSTTPGPLASHCRLRQIVYRGPYSKRTCAGGMWARRQKILGGFRATRPWCTRRALAKRKSKLRKDAAEVDPKDVSRFHKMEALATELTRTSLVPTRVGGRARDTIKELGN
jgi:hypothetical protein